MSSAWMTRLTRLVAPPTTISVSIGSLLPGEQIGLAGDCGAALLLHPPG